MTTSDQTREDLIKELESLHRQSAEFKALKAELRQTEGELRALNETMEQRVAERTAELAKANEELQTEVVKHRQAKEGLRESEKRYHTLAKVSPVGIWHSDAEGHCLYVNERWCEIAGLTLEKALAEGWAQALHPEDRERVYTEWYEAAKKKLPFKSEYRFLNPDGITTWVFGQAEPDISDSGEIVGYVGTITDITGRKRVEQALEKFKVLCSEVEDVTYICDTKGNVLYTNKAFEKLTGHKPEKFLGKPFAPLFDGENLKKVMDTYKKALNGESTITEACFKDTGIPCEFKSVPLRNENGEIIGVIGIGRDVTDRKRAEEELKTINETLEQRVTERTAELGKKNEELQTEITERKQVEAELKRTSEQLSLMLESLPVVNYTCTAHGNFGATYISSNVADVTGYKPEDFTSDDSFWASRIHPDDAPETFANLPKILERGHHEHEYRWRVADGSYRWFYDLLRLIKSPNGTPSYIVGAWLDITERKHAEENLERFEVLCSEMNDLSYICDAEGNVLYLNKVFEKFSGHKPENFFGKSFAPLFDGENLKKAMDFYSRTLQGESLRIEIPFKDTGTLCEFKNVPLRDNNGKIIGAIGTGRDMTERKRAEEALRESELRLHGILENSTAVIYLKDIEGRYIFVNRLYEDLFHVKSEELAGKTDYDVFPKKIAEAFQANDRKVLEAGIPLQLEEVALHGDGTHTYISIKFPLFGPDGVPHAVCGISTDITERKRMEEELKELNESLEQRVTERTTELARKNEELLAEIAERKRAEEALRESEGKYRRLIETASDAIFVADAETGIILDANKRAEELIGLPTEDIVGMHQTQLHMKEDVERYKKLFKDAVNEGGPKTFSDNLYVSHKDGRKIPVEISSSVMELGGKKIIQGIFRDIGERKRAEAALLQSEKLKALGVIASGIAHDFNNTLAIIQGNLWLMERLYGDHIKIKDKLRIIREAATDGAETVRRISEFTRSDSDSPREIPVDTTKLIKRVVDFTRPRWKDMAQANGITYEMDMDGLKQVPAVLGNPTELREVLVNIVNNALEAMPGGGRLSFRTWTEDGSVYVGISDNGVGMSKDVQMSIFDPFFTTKGPEGSGLGMSVAYGIIKRHGGEIDVESKEGIGSTVIFNLPTAAGKATGPQPLPKASTTIDAGKYRILVVDDEQEICHFLSEFLSQEGYVVKSTSSGAEAIKLLESENFDLVLSDLAMPEVSGREILNTIKKLEKRPKTGIITGWAGMLDALRDDSLPVDFVIDKPAEPLKVSALIAKALGMVRKD